MGKREHSRCSGCGEAILWAKTFTGKRMPLDVAPTVDGNVALDFTSRPPTATVYGTSDMARGALGRTAVLRTCHFATCTHRDSFRKPRVQPEPAEVVEPDPYEQAALL